MDRSKCLALKYWLIIILVFATVFTGKSKADNTDSTDETISDDEVQDYDIWMADTLLADEGLYKWNFLSMQDPVYKQLGGSILDDSPLVTISAAWSVYFNSDYRDQFYEEQKYIYELILLDYLKDGYDSGLTQIEIADGEAKYYTKMCSYLAKELKENASDYLDGSMTVEQAGKIFNNIQIFYGASKLYDVYSKSAKTVNGLIESMSVAAALEEVKEEKILLLKNAMNACANSSDPNEDFIAACSDVIDALEATYYDNCEDYSVDVLWDRFYDEVWDILADANPVLKIVDKGVEYLDEVFDTSNNASNNLKLAYLYTVDCYMRTALSQSVTTYLDNKTSDNAQTFIACFEGYLEFQKFGNSYADNWLNGYLDSGVIANVVNEIFNRNNIETANELLNISKNQIKTRTRLIELIGATSNLYKNLYSDNEKIVVEASKEVFVPVSVTGISFDSDTCTLTHMNDVYIPSYTIYPSNATNQNVTITSSNPDVMTYSEYGYATIKSSGTTVITVTTEDGGYSAQQTVTIGDKAPVTNEEDEVNDSSSISYFVDVKNSDTHYDWDASGTCNGGVIKISITDLYAIKATSISISFDFSNGSWGGGVVGYISNQFEWTEITWQYDANETVVIDVDDLIDAASCEIYFDKIEIRNYWGSVDPTIGVDIHINYSDDAVADCTHNYIIKEEVKPTCTESGYITYICEDCNSSSTKIFEALGHTIIVDNAVAPTCTESGLTEGSHCSVCNEILAEQKKEEALGHTEVTDKAVAPTCTESGLTEGSHCSVCDEVLVAQEEVEALGHTKVTDKAVAPTCTESGLTEGSHCSVCNDTIVAQEEVKALGHTKVTDKAVAATCTESGLTEGSHCSVCGDTIVAQEKVAALGHTKVTDKAVAATCTKSGLTEGSHCSVCGDTIVAQEEVEALGHTKVTDKAVAATCTKSGLTAGAHCSVCNEVLTAQKTVAALGHKYTSKVTKATYTAKGYTTYTCSRCGNSYKSNYTNMLTLTKPTVKVANTSTGVQVTWSKTTGATCYIVYRKTGSGKWTALKTITSGSTVSYVDTTAKAGTTYYYTVRAYAGSNKSNKSSYVTDVSIKYLAQPTVTLTNTSTGVKISWTKSTGAGGYYVYRKAPGDKKWTLINKASNLSYTDTTAKVGTTYYYTVKAYSGKTYSSYVTDKTIKRLTQPVVTLSKVSSGVKVAWQKITGASGYYVYRKASGAKSWTLLKKLTSASTLSYTDATGKNGTTYYYTVKAYSGSINSSFVTNKSIKYKT